MYVSRDNLITQKSVKNTWSKREILIISNLEIAREEEQQEDLYRSHSREISNMALQLHHDYCHIGVKYVTIGVHWIVLLVDLLKLLRIKSFSSFWTDSMFRFQHLIMLLPNQFSVLIHPYILSGWRLVQALLLWQLSALTVPLANYCLTLAQSSHLCRIKVLTWCPRSQNWK